MAKVRNPFLSISATGSLAGMLCARGKPGVSTMRRKAAPSGPPSLSQLACRAAHRDATSAWHAMSDIERAAWNLIGAYQAMTGYAAFLSDSLKGGPVRYLTTWDNRATRWDQGNTNWDKEI